ncbi:MULTISPECIES: inositol monophosphatase family protein [Anaeromyxobacter]|uniref:inositol monophosphatase family protein n=1 Tax=Anaeromyxobacter TaxID=161492 RepID=UPI001F58C5DB|nr:MULTISPECIES: inositol monophosphatase family protein [unclassified Anaeromyxobacter]
MAELAELRDACAEAARRGGAVLREKWGGKRTIELKGGIDLVTDADRAAEAAVLGFLRSRLPGAAILAEESGVSGGDGGELRFFVDPLDGTTNYAHGVPHFAVNVAVADARGLAAGATYDPLRDELFTAARGEGAFLGDVRLRHSGRAELVGSLLVTGFPYDIHQHHDYPLRLFGAFLRRARAVRRFGSAALDLAYVAAGRFDGFWEQRLKPWDVAAGILLAREAGALVTDMAGGERMLDTGDIVAAPPSLHAPMLEVIGSVPR